MDILPIHNETAPSLTPQLDDPTSFILTLLTAKAVMMSDSL